MQRLSELFKTNLLTERTVLSCESQIELGLIIWAEVLFNHFRTCPGERQTQSIHQYAK